MTDNEEANEDLQITGHINKAEKLMADLGDAFGAMKKIVTAPSANIQGVKMSSAPDGESGQPVTVEAAATTARTLAEETAATAQNLADTLSGVLTAVSGKLADLEVYGKQDRANIVDLKTINRRYKHVLIGLSMSLVLDISLSVITILLGLGLSHQSSNQHTSLLASCKAGNITRIAEIAIWKRNILDFHNNAIGQSFVREVESTYAPVDCVKRYGK
jgi:hypothetical protein